jgi:hypothetical protein
MAKGPAEPGGFLEQTERMPERRNRDPFQRFWYEDGFRFDPYKEIAVAPVKTEYVRAMSFWERMSLATPGIEHDVESLAVELRGKFIEALRNDPNRRFEVVENAGDDGITLEIALIEVVPNKEWLGAIGLVAWGSPFLSAGVAASTVAEMFDRGWVSIEARIREGGSQRIVAQFADSETGRTRIIDLQVLTWYGQAHEIFSDWAHQFVERVNTPLEDPVQEAPWFSFRPW